MSGTSHPWTPRAARRFAETIAGHGGRLGHNWVGSVPNDTIVVLSSTANSERSVYPSAAFLLV